jgi:hypothetical protein
MALNPLYRGDDLKNAGLLRLGSTTWARSACEPIGWGEADLARWQRAMRPIRLAFNLIHHPDEPDGVRTRHAADPAGLQSDSPSGRAGWSPIAPRGHNGFRDRGCPGDRLSKYLHARPGCRFTSHSKSPNVLAEMCKS